MQSKTCFLARYRVRPTIVFGSIDASMTPRGQISALVGVSSRFVIRVEDGNSDSSVSLRVLEDPGTPAGMRIAQRNCSRSPSSACSVAIFDVEWTPPPVPLSANFSASLCVVVYDNDTECTNSSIGLMSPPVCLPLSVPVAQPRWSAASDAQQAAANGTFPVFVGAVGCRSFFVAAAEDAFYDVIVHPDAALPPGVTIVSKLNNARVVLMFSPHHGSEGTQHLICFSASVVQTRLALPPACTLLRVQRCAVCIGGSVTPGSPPLMSLLDVSRQLLGDVNWIRVWLANSGVSAAAQGLSTIQANANGTKVVIGPVFTARAAQSLADIALRFGTSIATLLKFNADLRESGARAGQEICILPCKR